jgi:hypothetical protein
MSQRPHGTSAGLQQITAGDVEQKMLTAAIKRRGDNIAGLEAVSVTPTTDLSDEAHSGSDNRSTVSSGDAHEAPREVKQPDQSESWAEFPPLRDSSGNPLRPRIPPAQLSVWEKTSAVECIKKRFGVVPVTLDAIDKAVPVEAESATVETLTVETETVTLETGSEPSGQAATPRPLTPASSLTATDSDVPNTPDYDGMSRASQRYGPVPVSPYVFPAAFAHHAQITGAWVAPDLTALAAAAKSASQLGQGRDASPRSGRSGQSGRSGSESSVASTASSPQWSTRWSAWDRVTRRLCTPDL